MRILVIVQGEYGRRIANNVMEHAPDAWTVESWEAPAFLPPIIDYPEEFLPESLPASDLIVSLGENPGVAVLLPEIAQMTGADAAIAPVDNVDWLPTGLMNQLAGWLADLEVASVFPKPFCSLTESSYNHRHLKKEYDNSLIAEFARHFGKPQFRLQLDPQEKTVTQAEVVRDSACGCAHYVAEGLVGISADEAEHEAGMLHHHFPCLASMGIDSDYNDTLMHVSGNILKAEIADEVRPYRRPPRYVKPPGRSED